MENVEIARILNNYADLLEIQGGDLFRILAYRNAARTVESLSQPIAQFLEEGEDIKELPGIGKNMAAHIEEIVSTGTLKKLTQLRKKFPTTLNELLEIEGLGPKRTKLLYKKLGVASVKQLRQALDLGKLERLHGFGAKSVDKLRQAVQSFEKRPNRFKLIDADQFVRPLVEFLRKDAAIERLDVAGSYRRRVETVGDIDILAACEKPAPVMKRFQSYREVERVAAAGETRATVILRSGLQVDLRLVPLDCYGAALHYFTGSKTHNVAVRKIGVERGLRISEYGIFRLPKGMTAEDLAKQPATRIGGAREEDVFKAVGLDWIPSELRENRGEIEAAAKHELPDLIALEDIRGDLQLHTKWTDGKNTIEEMARACKDRGYEYCAITDHTSAVRVAGGLSADEFKRQLDEIEKARQKIAGIAIFAGCEADILPDGTLDLPDGVLERFDVVIAAVHSKMDMSKSEMTRRVVKALGCPAVDILAHPTGRIINKRDPFAIDLEEIFNAAKENDVAVELNAQPDRLDLSDVHAHRAREVGIKIAIDTDAHSVEHLRFMSYGVDQARRGWLEKRNVLNAMAIPQLMTWLKRRRQASKAALRYAKSAA